MIQSQIVSYWQDKEQLPQDLEDLEDPLRGFLAPMDPQTEEPYGYRAMGARTFELCATFNLESTEEGSFTRRAVPIGIKGTLFNENWQHEAGDLCFERTIDPDLFPPRSQMVR